MLDAYIYDGVRTPFGKAGPKGMYYETRADDLVIKCIRGGRPAPAKPWDGAEGLEWSVPSPAPYHTFQVPPEVK